MDRFGDDLNVLNKDRLRDLWMTEMMCKLRKHIYNFMLSRTRESDFFDIDTFNRKYVNNINVTNDLVNTAVEELVGLGWKTHIGFGGTGLYVYSSDELPAGVY